MLSNYLRRYSAEQFWLCQEWLLHHYPRYNVNAGLGEEQQENQGRLLRVATHGDTKPLHVGRKWLLNKNGNTECIFSSIYPQQLGLFMIVLRV